MIYGCVTVRISCMIRYRVWVSLTVRVSLKVIQLAILSCNCVFNVLARSVPAMTTFNRALLFSVWQLAGDRSTVTNGRSLLHSYIHAGDSVSTIVFGVFFTYKKNSTQN